MASGGINFRRGALDELARDALVRRRLDEDAKAVRDRARATARRFAPRRVEAIEVEEGADATGPYADVGYLKDHPGYVLWWQEVGTLQHPAKPHLRPALRPGG